PAPDFALLHRAGTPGLLDVLTGEVVTVPRLADLPLPPVHPGTDRHDLLVLVPYRQLAERGYACHDDGTPPVALRPTAQARVPVAEALAVLPGGPVTVTGGGFDLDDAAYAAVVRRVLAGEIGAGEGSNFVIRRSFVATLEGDRVRGGLAVFRRLLAT